MTQQQRVRDVVYPAISQTIAKTRQRQRDDFALTHRTIPAGYFPDGAVVMIEDVAKTNKSEPKFVGPYTISARLTSGVYLLKDTEGAMLRRTVPASMMKLVTRNPSAVPSTDAETYAVSHVSAHRGPAAHREYLVHWVGFADPT